MIESEPIGIFDSGVGGLTVFKEIRNAFPDEDIVYFGDTARVPYGTKSKETVIEYSKQNARFLLQHSVKVIVVACNTSSAFALDELQKMTSIPVIGVIKAGAETAVKNTKTGKIGVIGTVGTINSQAYQKAIKKIDPNIEVTEKACPLFVPLAEEGWHDSHITKQIAEIYLDDILAKGIDTLVLGCTHYPILKNIIQDVCGDKVRLIDSAEAVSNDLKKILLDKNKRQISLGDTSDVTQSVVPSSDWLIPAGNISDIPRAKESKPKNSFFVSDFEDKFVYITRNVLDIKDFSLNKVQIDCNPSFQLVNKK